MPLLSTMPADARAKMRKNIRTHQQLRKDRSFRLVEPTQPPIRRQEGPAMLLMVHLDNMARREQVLRVVGSRFKSMEQVACELIDGGICEPPTIDRDQVFHFSDEIGGFYYLSAFLKFHQQFNRFVLTGGGLGACLLKAADIVLGARPSGNVEFYLPLDLTYHKTLSDDPLDGKRLVVAAGYFSEYAGLGYGTGLWLDDEIVALTHPQPTLKIRAYTSAALLFTGREFYFPS